MRLEKGRAAVAVLWLARQAEPQLPPHDVPTLFVSTWDYQNTLSGP